MDNNNKYGFLTPWGFLPTGKGKNTELMNFDRFISHFSDNSNFIVSMFDYDGLPESIDERFIEIYLSGNGSIAWLNPSEIRSGLPDELIVIRGGRSDGIGNYGLGNHYIGSNDNPEIGSISAEVGTQCIVGYNNSVMSPDFDSWYYADLLKECEKSIRFNIRYARLAPILKASDPVKREALEKLLNDIDDGNMVNIITSNVVEEMLKDDGSNTYEAIHLTENDDIRNLQYVIKGYEDLLRIYHTKYGQAEQGSGKMAQQTVDEVNGTASSSFVLALDKLKQRQKMIEAVNTRFGTSINVRFSPAWDLEYQRYINRIGATDPIEGSEDKSTDVSELSSELESELSGELESEEEGERDE